jgi:CDP-diglyceride synthetase
MNATRADLPVRRSPATWRYVIVPAAFVLAYFAARGGIESSELGSGAALAWALLPVPIFAFVIWCYARAVRGMDELERRIQLEGLALAFPIALLVAFTAGLLDLAGFHGKGNWDLPRLWPLLLLPYWLGIALARRRYA